MCRLEKYVTDINFPLKKLEGCECNLKRPYGRDLRKDGAIFPYILMSDINLMIN